MQETKLTFGKDYAPATYNRADQEQIQRAKDLRYKKLARVSSKIEPALIVGAPETTSDGSRKFVVTLRYQQREIETEFTMGAAHLNPPTFAHVLYCLLIDCSNIEFEDFAGFCDNLGLSTDSIKARVLFDQCRDTLPQLAKLLGLDMNRVRAMDEEGVMAEFA